MLYSPSLITEILLIIELILAVQLVAFSTNSFSYLRRQIRTADSCWKDGNYLYYTASPSAQELLNPQSVVDRYPEVEEYFQGTPETRAIVSKELKDWSNEGQVVLVRCSSSMLGKMATRLDIHTEIDSGETVAVCVPPTVAKIYPPGAEIILTDENWEKARFTVCGVIRKEELPITAGAGSLKTVESLAINCPEQQKSGNIVFVSVGEKNIPFTAGMFRLSANADAAKLAEELSREYVNSGEFCPYTAMKELSESTMISNNPVFLLQTILFLLVFISHFVGYLSISTRNKERTNSLLSISGMSSTRLSRYNAGSIALLIFPALLLGALITPLTEKWTGTEAYGGHLVAWECLAVFAAVMLLTTFLTVRIRIRKGNTILLYRKGT